jgi:hypothetical protein
VVIEERGGPLAGFDAFHNDQVIPHVAGVFIGVFDRLIAGAIGFGHARYNALKRQHVRRKELPVVGRCSGRHAGRIDPPRLFVAVGVARVLMAVGVISLNMRPEVVQLSHRGNPLLNNPCPKRRKT